MTNLELISILVCVAGVFGWIASRWLKLPTTIGTMLLTIVASLAMLFSGTVAPELHAWAYELVRQIHFGPLFMDAMLPLLLFAGAFLLDLEALAEQKLMVGTLALAGTILAAGAVAGLMHVTLPLFGIQAGWLPCFFFGALISPTDPIAVLELLRRVGVKRNIQAQLAGESLFNDGVGAVLFLTLLDVARGTAPTAGSIAAMFLLKAGGALVLGVALAYPVSQLIRLIRAYELEIILSLGLALGGYALADWLHLSAPLEAVAAGLALRRFNRDYTEEISHERLEGFWETIDHIQNSVLFVLLGLGVISIGFNVHALESGIAGIASVTAVRFAVVAALVTLVCRIQRGHESSVKLLTWGGLRGGLSLALALSIPASVNEAWILPTTYFIVVFSIVIQGGSMGLFLQPQPSLGSAEREEAEKQRSRVTQEI